MEKIELKAATRDTLGKKVRFLRREGVTPANVYGHNVKSTALQIETALLKRTIATAGTSSLIALKIDGEKSPRMVLIRGYQRHPLRGDLLHTDFYQVKMAEKIKVEVPLSLVGESPAVADLDGIMLQDLSSVEVECLPADIPHLIEVDLSALEKIDQSIHVTDLTVGKSVTILTDPEKVVVIITSRRVEAAEAAEGVPEAGAAAEAAGEAAAEEPSSD
ncbi:MAG: 50S ribosomal protein L25 [Dehalococcoidia bacterium]